MVHTSESEETLICVKGNFTTIYIYISIFHPRCKSLHVATDHQPLVGTLGKQSVGDVPNKRLARIKERLGDSPWSTTHARLTVQQRHMLYVSIDKMGPDDSTAEFREILELNLKDAHVTVNLVNNDEEVHMMSTKQLRRTVFWLKINPDIIKRRGGCMNCVREAPSSQLTSQSPRQARITRSR